MKIKSIKKNLLDTPKQFYDVINAYPYNNFLIATDNAYVCAHNCLFASMEDEVDFSAMTTNVEKNKKRMLSIISKVDARMKSRFLRTKNGKPYLPTLNLIISSKDSEQSFLETFIDTKKKNDSKTTLVVDEPQWVVDERKNSDEKFYVAIGNKYLANELLPDDATKELVDEYRAKGYSILEVPIGYLENFKDNIDKSLTEIAGISTQSSVKYISGMRWNEIKTDSYENPFIKEEIEVGTGREDTAQYSDFFDLSRVPSKLKSKDLYIHLDMSKGSGGKGDRTGIAGIYVLGKKPKVEGEPESKELFYQVAFDVAIKAPKGQEISFDKNRNFIRWLRKQGFNVKGVSSDTYNAAQIQQQLTADEFNVSTISVDRVDTQSKMCLPYEYFKSTITERRIQIYRKCDILTEEIIGLEKESDGHIQHPEGGTQGCFTGDTKVSLVDGRELTFLQLIDEFNSGKENFVYSFNERTKIIEPKKVLKAWKTQVDDFTEIQFLQILSRIFFGLTSGHLVRPQRPFKVAICLDIDAIALIWSGCS